MKIELSIRQVGQNWQAENNLISLSAASLDELDDRLRLLLKEKKMLAQGEKATVLMFFNNKTIPQWIRQYANHYFNRSIEIYG